MKVWSDRFIGVAASAARLATAFVCLAAVTAAWPQSARMIKIVVPYLPGGGADVVARVMADAIGNMHGPTMVVENRAYS